MLVLLASLFTLLAVTLVVWALLQPRPNPLAVRLTLAEAAKISHDPDLDRPLWERAGVPVCETLVGAISRLAPPKMLERLDTQLTVAGRPGGLSAPAFLTVSLLATMVTPSLYLLTGTGLGTINTNQVLVGLLLALICFQLPRSWLSIRIKKRQKQVQKSLPDAMDLIVVCVEAGLGLDAALAKVSEEMEGPLSQELRRALLESSMGKLRRNALRDMARRLQVADLTSFISALVQADQMGTSLSQVLRAQSAQMRVKRRQRAEQEAMRAPLKMMFPLVFCIFPATFVVILGPAAVNLMRTFAAR